MEKNILKVDPVALSYDDVEMENEDFNDENDFEWDQKDLKGDVLEKMLNEEEEKEREMSLDGLLEDDEI